MSTILLVLALIALVLSAIGRAYKTNVLAIEPGPDVLSNPSGPRTPSLSRFTEGSLT